MSYIIRDLFINHKKNLISVLKLYDNHTLKLRIIMKMIDNTDQEIIKEFEKNNLIIKFRDVNYAFKRANWRCNMIKGMMKKWTSMKSPKRILDIGVNTGYVTGTLQTIYKKAKIFGIDVVDEREYKIGYSFKKYDGYNIPFKNMDLITMLMVFHHIKNITKFMKSLKKSINKNGYIFVRDHNIVDDKLVRFQHMLYGEFDDQYYYSADKIIKIFKKHRFKLIKKFITSKKTNYSTFIFQKLE